MTPQDPNITSSQARSALDTLANTKDQLNRASRPPAWLNLLASGFLGLESLSVAYANSSSFWHWLMLGSMTAFMLCLVFWMYRLRQWGLKVRAFPAGKTNKLLTLLHAATIVVLMFGGKAGHEAGIAWAPFVTAIINALALFYFLHRYPMGQWLSGRSSQ